MQRYRDIEVVLYIYVCIIYSFIYLLISISIYLYIYDIDILDISDIDRYRQMYIRYINKCINVGADDLSMNMQIDTDTVYRS